MPLYLFEAADGEQVLIEMDTKQPAESYHQQIVRKKLFKRVYTVPHAAINSQRIGTSEDEFRRATSNKNLTVGQMQDLSKEMHEKRLQKEGRDQIKEQWYKEYEKNIGQKHADIKRRERQAATKERTTKAKKKLDKMGVSVTF